LSSFKATSIIRNMKKPIKKKQTKQNYIGKVLTLVLAGGYEVIGTFMGQSETQMMLKDPHYFYYTAADIFKQNPIIQFIRFVPFAQDNMIPISINHIVSCTIPMKMLEDGFKEYISVPPEEKIASFDVIKSLIDKAHDEHMKEQLENLSVPQANTAKWQ
jgi:hypothetical protein